jgi:hypothetical protein
MIDLFLHAPSREALAADLAPFSMALDGNTAAGSTFAFSSFGQIPGSSGVYACLRCLDDSLAAALHVAAFAKGTRIVARPGGVPVFAGKEEPDLETAKAAACAAIDAEAERRRLMVLTPGQGQAMEYQHTAEEAARAVAAPDPLDPAAYPFLAAEQEALLTTIGEVSLRDVAVAILADRATWMAYGAAIKAARRRAKLLVRMATDAAAVAVAAAGITWPEKP